MNAFLRRGVHLVSMLVLSATSVPAQTRSDAYGTSNVTYYRVGTTEFRAYSPADAYFDDGRSLWPVGEPGGPTGWFNAIPHLPSGARLTYLELVYCDINTTGLHVRLNFQYCDPILDSCITVPGGVLTSVEQPVGAPCASASAAINHVVDNATQTLNLDLHFGAFDRTNLLRGVVIGYELQVSPAPATATFNDVLTTHPLFQFVEALADSGITVGCGAGNFCPDSPVTRGQLAVFLAKALGLNWTH